MQFSFKDKVAFVTGAGSGIGRATAHLFAKNGASVLVADMNSQGGEETVSQIRKAGGKTAFQRCDVGNEGSVHEALERTLKEFRRIDFAFNNAGIEGTQAWTDECTSENWEKVLHTNLTGIWYCMKHQIPLMKKNESGGSIVNCASIAGLVGFPGLPAYVASKHGVVGLTKTAALELAKANIRVNCVCPGAIQTPMIDRLTSGGKTQRDDLIKSEPIGRIGKPEEIASAVAWLCSDGASFVTGHPMVVDGGWVAC